MIKAVITDLDRTLLRTDKTVSEYTYAVLKKCQRRGILFMAATARPERAILAYQNQIGFEAMATLNGARGFFPMSPFLSGMRLFSTDFLRCRQRALYTSCCLVMKKTIYSMR